MTSGSSRVHASTDLLIVTWSCSGKDKRTNEIDKLIDRREMDASDLPPQGWSTITQTLSGRITCMHGHRAKSVDITSPVLGMNEAFVLVAQKHRLIPYHNLAGILAL